MILRLHANYSSKQRASAPNRFSLSWTAQIAYTRLRTIAPYEPLILSGYWFIMIPTEPFATIDKRGTRSVYGEINDRRIQ